MILLTAIIVLKHHVNKKIDNTCVLSILFVLVGLAGLEPVRVSSLDPKSYGYSGM